MRSGVDFMRSLYVWFANGHDSRNTHGGANRACNRRQFRCCSLEMTTCSDSPSSSASSFIVVVFDHTLDSPSRFVSTTKFGSFFLQIKNIHFRQSIVWYHRFRYLKGWPSYPNRITLEPKLVFDRFLLFSGVCPAPFCFSSFGSRTSFIVIGVCVGIRPLFRFNYLKTLSLSLSSSAISFRFYTCQPRPFSVDSLSSSSSSVFPLLYLLLYCLHSFRH